MDNQNINWINLLDCPEEYQLPFGIPSEFWYLRIFEIVLELDNEHYLVLEYPFYSYNDVVNNKIKECIWSPPYIASKFDIGPKRLRTKALIIDEYEKIFKAKDAYHEELTAFKFYTMGIGSYKLQISGKLLEYKHSFREPLKWKCYYVERYTVTGLDNFDLYNIVDPECIKGYTYLNIENSDKILLKGNNDKERCFKGKPLSTNTSYLFLNGVPTSLIRSSNKITKDFLTYNERGMLFSFDLNTYGQNQKLIKENYKTLQTAGDLLADEFEFFLNEIFGIALNSLSYNQFRLMGDGFIAASPERHVSTPENNYELVVEYQLSNALKAIDFILSELRKKAPLYPDLRAKASILSGDYYYGKIGGLICDKSDLGGQNITRVVRQQSLIDEWLKLNIPPPTSISLAIQQTFFQNNKEVFLKHGYTNVDLFTGSHKEFSDSIIILSK